MDKIMTEQLTVLRQLPDDEAATWIMQHYPLSSAWLPATIYIRHLSWRQSTRKHLFEYYFSEQRWGNESIYTAFLSIMPVKEFLALLEPQLQVGGCNNFLLEYHLESVFSRMLNDDEAWHPKTREADQALVRAFLHRLPALLYAL